MKEEIFKKNAELFAVKLARKAYLNGLDNIVPQIPSRQGSEYLIKFMTKTGVDWPVAFKLKEDGRVKMSEIFKESCGSKILSDIEEFKCVFDDYGFESVVARFKSLVSVYIAELTQNEKPDLDVSSRRAETSSFDK